MGFTIITESNSFARHLFSFSTTGDGLLDHYDLSQDFSPGPFATALVKMHRETGLLLVYGSGQSSERFERKVVAFAVDETGRLSKRWVFELPPALLEPEIVFNSDGSRIYVLYNEGKVISGEGPDAIIEITTRVALLDAQDGKRIAVADLLKGELLIFAIFNEVRQRAIMVAGGSAYVFEPDPNSLKIEYTVSPPAFPPPDRVFAGRVDLSKDGRFLVVYGGYNIFQTIPAPPVPAPDLFSNLFYSYDLDSRTFTKTFIKEFSMPVSVNIAFNRPTGSMFVPLSTHVEPGQNGSVFFTPNRGSRLANKLTLTDDGVLVRGDDLLLPKRSAGSDILNRINQFSTIAFSESGEMAFISTGNGRLFTFDTSTSEIVNDQLLDANELMSIQLLEDLKLLAYGNRTNMLSLVDINTGPVVESLSIKGNRATIKGANFLAGARVEIDGEVVEGSRRTAKKPGGEIKIPLSKADYPRGRKFTLIVINRDGKRSQSQTFQR